MNRLLGITAAAVAAVALAVAIPSTALAAQKGSKSPKDQCEAGGHQWTAGKGCADKKCNVGGKLWEPGSVRQMHRAGGQVAYLYCNGFTGKFESAA